MEGSELGTEMRWTQEGKSTCFSVTGDHHPPVNSL